MSKKILIVDDEDFFVRPIKMALEQRGFEVITAEDGVTGLQKARKEMPDIIMLDLMLPGLDGYQVCRLLKFDDKFRQIPVIIVSAKDTDKDRKLAEQSGADVYLTKPINAPELAEKFALLLTEE